MVNMSLGTIPSGHPAAVPRDWGLHCPLCGGSVGWVGSALGIARN